MPVQEAKRDQDNLAMAMHFSGYTHSQILKRLQDKFVYPISRRTLTNWIARYKQLDKEGISRDAPFQLHLLADYGLPVEASQFISDMIYRMNTASGIPFYDSRPNHIQWKPTFREVEWWWRVHNMAEDFDFRDVYLVATHYCVRELLEEVGGIPAEYSDLNAYMTYQPWRNEVRGEEYKEAIKEQKFTEIDPSDYGTRGLLTDDGRSFAIATTFPVIHPWADWLPRYMTPYKSLMMTIYVQTMLAGRVRILEVPEEEAYYTMKWEATEGDLEILFDKEEREMIEEYIRKELRTQKRQSRTMKR